jgi:hypothetical protein
MVHKLINEQKVTLKKVEPGKDGKLADRAYYECEFCWKTVGFHPVNREVCETIAGGSFYCPFCLRHDLHTKKSKDVLVISFRAILGTFYYGFYLGNVRVNKQMWFSEIQDYIKVHVETGLQNPIFSYDPETMLWFVDFSKVGRGKKKVPLESVLKTVLSILSCFNLKYNFPHGDIQIMYEKYEEAIQRFYSHRYRPSDKKFLIPTLTTLMNETKGFKLENTRNFSQKKMLIKQ